MDEIQQDKLWHPATVLIRAALAKLYLPTFSEKLVLLPEEAQGYKIFLDSDLEENLGKAVAVNAALTFTASDMRDDGVTHFVHSVTKGSPIMELRGLFGESTSYSLDLIPSKNQLDAQWTLFKRDGVRD